MYCWIIAFTTIAFLGIHNSRIQANDIQKSRLTSCIQTYEGIREVFKPFFRPSKQRTDKEKRDIAKFNKTVNDLKAKCSQQVKPK